MERKFYLLEAIKPKPMPFDLICVGNGKDGTYLIPNDLIGIDACFSPGVNNYKFFEDYLAKNFNIKSHMCDFTSDIHKFDTPLIEGLQTFRKKWLDVNGSDDSITLEDWINECSPNPEDDLILQMDIEGAEFRNLNNLKDDILNRFRIIVIEIHGFGAVLSNQNNEVQDLLIKLTQSFDVVHATANNCCGEVLDSEFKINLPNLIEMTFLRKDRILDSSQNLIYPSLPSVFDIVNTNSRPIFLNSKWLYNDKCALNFDVIDRDLNKYDAEFYKRQVDLLKICLGNIGQQLPKNPLLNSNLINYDLDLALGKPYTLDSNEVGYVNHMKPFFFNTIATEFPSITVDLIFEYEIGELRIFNRTDTCFERAELLAYVIHTEKLYHIDDIHPIYVSTNFLTGKESNITRIPFIKGRYLTILNMKKEALHLSSIEIYSSAKDSLFN